ncbi:hypothetical protein [Protaetiibacter intestinalis]|uniref:FtsX-like permease family protein n=1 Tax=Protaetiibacter intestinalis TaxID=2419774 RepID=A0A387B420_9MICO|nr:hypothetical protein [Protaetiibacter intestinalis]AYF97057.1 hypothetical protein D7I47_01510 [Protaetiibacter intestinalis]
MRLLLRRTLARADQLAAAALVIAIGAGAIVTLVTALGSGLDAGVAAVVHDAEPTAGALRVDTALAPDPQAQRLEYHAELEEAIGSAPLDIVRSVRSEPVPALVGGTARPVVLGSEDALDRLAGLVAGDWPTDETEATVSEAAARELGVAVGDTLAAAGREFRISGIWRAHDPADAAWFSETAIASGLLGDAAGPVMVHPDALAGLAPRPAVAWTIVPRDDAVDVASLAALSTVESRLRGVASRLGSGGSYAVTVSGGLTDTVARAQDAVQTARVLGGVALVIVAVAAAIVLGLIGRSLAQLRAEESRLLAARGLAPARAAVIAAREALGTALLGTAAGLGAAVGVCALAGFGPPALETVLVGAALGVLGGTVLFALAARPDAAEVRRVRTRRARPVAETESVAPALAVAVLAALALLAGTNRTTAAPVALVAPALVLVAGVLLVRLLVAPALRLAELAAARRPGLLPVLPLRQLARRPRAVAAAFVVVALAAGTIVFASAAQAAVHRADAAAVSAGGGGDVRIRFTGVDRDPVRPADYAQLDGVDAAAGVALGNASFGRVAARLLVASQELGRVDAAAAPPVAGEALAVVLTPALASRIGVGIGDTVAMAMTGAREPLPVTVARIAALPAVGEAGVLVDGDALAAALPEGSHAPAVDEVWLAADDPTAVALAVREASVRPATVIVPSALTTAAVGGVGGGAATLAALVVTVIAWGGFAAAAATLARLRREELVPLRSLGLGARAQARARVVELCVTALAAALGGAGAGALAAGLAVRGPLVAGGVDPALLLTAVALPLGVVVIALLAGAATSRAGQHPGGGR